MKPNPAEYTLCAWVEFAYQALTAMIDWCLNVISMELQALVASLNALYALMVQQMEKGVDAITEMLSNCVDAGASKISEDDLNWLNNVRTSLCEMLRKCTIVAEILAEQNKVPGASQDTWLDFTNLESVDTPPYFAELHDPYLWLTKVVCNFSLKDLIAQAGNLTKDLLREKMDLLIWGDGTYGLSWAQAKAQSLWTDWDNYIHKPLDKITPNHLFSRFWKAYFSWIPERIADPKTMNIFDLMALLDKLADCAFAICNFATSVLTYKQDKKTKMYIDWETELPIPPTVLTGIYKVSTEFNQLTEQWKNSTASACIG